MAFPANTVANETRNDDNQYDTAHLPCSWVDRH